MKFLVIGGTGFIGRHLVNDLINANHKVTMVIRSYDSGSGISALADMVLGDPLEPGEWQRHAEEADIVINLVGRSIMGRWSHKVMKEIIDTRIRSTEQVVKAIKQYGKPGCTLINASAIGYYGDTGDQEVTEEARKGEGFLAELTEQWETAALKAKDSGNRVVLARISVVMGHGGMLSRLLPLFKIGLGGPFGSGNQWMSWIHMSDLTRAMVFVSEDNRISGPVNLCAPYPCTNNDFTRALASLLGRHAFLRVPEKALKLVLGRASELPLFSQKVIPKVLKQAGFKFRFPTIESCLLDLLGSDYRS